MGLRPTTLKLIIKLHKEVGLQGPVMTLGNQDILATYDELRSFFRQMDCPFYEVEFVKNTSAGLRRLISRSVEFPHAKVFFAMMGIDEYYDIDKYDYDKPEIHHDLNLPIPKILRDRFSLVIDGGTMEHVFDVKTVFENITRMLRVGGWAIHIAPSSHFIDHGFYSFSPCLFYDFYSVNGFEDFRCYVIERKSNPLKALETCSCVEYSYNMPINYLIDDSRSILVFFAARKTSYCTSINIPNQGYYDPERKVEVADAPSYSIYTPVLTSIYERWVPKPLQPALNPLRPLLGSMYYHLFPRKPRRLVI